jgi:hypothetical protein
VTQTIGRHVLNEHVAIRKLSGPEIEIDVSIVLLRQLRIQQGRRG